LDVALIGQRGAVAARDFYSRKFRSLGVCAALSDEPPLAACSRLGLDELRGHDFIGMDEEQMPGRNARMKALCLLWQRAETLPSTRLLVEALAGAAEGVAQTAPRGRRRGATKSTA